MQRSAARHRDVALSVGGSVVAAEGSIDWLAYERHKKPPVRRSWASLDERSGVAICITGAPGHQLSC
jgi:hypothetical protein